MNSVWLHRFEIKPNRWIYVPTRETLDYGNLIKSSLVGKWKAPSFYYHLNAGGHVKLVHDAKDYRYFSRYDFENYFAQVTRNRISRCLKDYFGYDQAREIATRSTVTQQQSHSVPYGFPQSMLLASIVLDHSRLGKYFYRLKHQGFFVGVYVDDVIIASNNQEELQKASAELEKMAVLSNLVFSKNKIQRVLDKISPFNIDLAFSSLNISYPRFAQFVERIQSENDNLTKRAIKGYVDKINPKQAGYLSLLGKFDN